MSDIDLIKHYRLGQFLEIPIYQCLEDGSRLGCDDQPPQPSLVCEKGYLCIGGGSGEHPAIVIKSVEYCVSRFLMYEHDVDTKDIKSAASKDIDDVVIFASWTKKEIKAFKKEIRKLTFANKGEEFSYMILKIGEFIFHYIPHYNSQILKWKELNQNIDLSHADLHGISLPLDEYGGNGKDRFKIVFE